MHGYLSMNIIIMLTNALLLPLGIPLPLHWADHTKNRNEYHKSQKMMVQLCTIW